MYSGMLDPPARAPGRRRGGSNTLILGHDSRDTEAGQGRGMRTARRTPMPRSGGRAVVVETPAARVAIVYTGAQTTHREEDDDAKADRLRPGRVAYRHHRSLSVGVPQRAG